MIFVKKKENLIDDLIEAMKTMDFRENISKIKEAI